MDKWTSRKESEPSKDGEYLVTCGKLDSYTKQFGIAPLCVKIASFIDGHWFDVSLTEYISAWMPLPEPYNVEQSGK